MAEIRDTWTLHDVIAYRESYTIKGEIQSIMMKQALEEARG